jgi:ubiquinone/menaquinone biosynthesis C-methylase UbiE
MAEMTNFTQPDTAAAYLIDFLQFLDNHVEIKNLRAECIKRMNLVIGNKVLDLGCGIGGATFPIADAIGTTGNEVPTMACRHYIHTHCNGCSRSTEI